MKSKPYKNPTKQYDRFGHPEAGIKKPIAGDPLMRVRFHVPDSSAPVQWPIPHPMWETGSADNYNIVVAYAKDVDEVLRYWPDAEEIDILEQGLTEYTYTDRFREPEWMDPEVHAMLVAENQGQPVYGASGNFPYTLEGYADACRYTMARREPVTELGKNQKLKIHMANMKWWGADWENHLASGYSEVSPKVARLQAKFMGKLSDNIHESMAPVVTAIQDWFGYDLSTYQTERLVNAACEGLVKTIEGRYHLFDIEEPEVNIGDTLFDYFNAINT